jgi:hypothetical protein
MQTVYIARVKDGRVSNDSPQKHYYGRTAHGFASSNSNYFYKYLKYYKVLSFLHKKERSHKKWLKRMSNTSLI